MKRFIEMKYAEVIQRGTEYLETAHIADAKIDARLLLEFVCQTSYNTLFTEPDRKVSDEQYQLYQTTLERRASHEPLQYITGECDFMGLTFTVTPDVLIPRQDTENLVEEVMRDLHSGMEFLDMCTGSGCIILSLLHYSNECKGTGVDISPKALSVAKKNGERLGISVNWIESDLFENVTGRFDKIISNPPYIATKVIGELMEEVKEHEPVLALDGMEDGLHFYRRIISDAKKHLYRNGVLYFEIGYDQGEEVSTLMKDAGYIDVNVVKDFSGNDRVVYGTYIEDAL